MNQAMSVLVSQASVEWNTPEWIIVEARKILGTPIGLDPASNMLAQSWIKAERWYGQDHASEEKRDGLSLPWSAESIWLNPPYNKVSGKSSQGIWIEEAIKRFDRGEFKRGIILVNSKPGYEWYERALDRLAWCMLRQRVHFLNEAGDDVGPAKVGQTLLCIGSVSTQLRFKDVFEQFGRCGGPKTI